jgi:hypothetical protein
LKVEEKGEEKGFTTENPEFTEKRQPGEERLRRLIVRAHRSSRESIGMAQRSLEGAEDGAPLSSDVGGREKRNLGTSRGYLAP